MSRPIDKIRELIDPLFAGSRFYLVDLELRGKRGSRVLGVYADTEAGITLDEITYLTREINDLLDTHTDVIEGPYRLDVSSPGIDRWLTQPRELRKHIGRNLRVLYEEASEQTEIIGKLTAVEEDQLLLKAKKEEIHIPMSAVLKARVHLKW